MQTRKDWWAVERRVVGQNMKLYKKEKDVLENQIKEFFARKRDLDTSNTNVANENLALKI